MPILIMLVAIAMILYGLIVGVAAKTALHEIYGGLSFVGGVTVFALGYLGLLVTKLTFAIDVHADKLEQSKMPVSPQAEKVRQAEIADTITCPNCRRVNKSTDTICECGMPITRTRARVR